MACDTQFAVPLSRLIGDGTRVEVHEAVAILEAVWAAASPTLDARGCFSPLPSPDQCLLTAFGDIEVEQRGQPTTTCAPGEQATALCRLLAQLTSSPRGGDDALGPRRIDQALAPVRAQAGGEGSIAFETPDALLAAWRWARASDGSAARADLYARWEVTTASISEMTLLPTAPPPAPAVPSTSTATLRRSGRAGVRRHITLSATAAATLIVLAAGIARVRHGWPSDDPAASTRESAVDTASGHGHGNLPPSRARDAAAAAAAPAPPESAQTGTVAVAAAPHRLVRAADVGAAPYSPSFAPLTGALLFHSGTSRTGLHEATLGTDGTPSRVRTLLRDGANSYHVQISPDGTRLAFDSDREGERAVYVAAAHDGSGVRRISGTGMALVPSWSPDGTRVAFVRAEPQRPRVWQLWTVDLRTGRLQQHTSHRVGQPWGGSWFPDGRRIAYSLEDRLVVLDVQSGERRVYASPLPGRLVRTPAVSPDGSHVVFQVRQSGVWLLHPESGRTERLLADRSAQEFAWSPDGRAVAFHSTRGGTWEIWALPVTGL